MTLEEKAEKYVFSNPPSVVIDNHSYFLPSDLKQAYLAGAKELEQKNRLLGERCNQLLKNKGELTDQIADIKANCDFAIEGRDIKIKELEEANNKLLDVINNQDVKIADLEQQVERMKVCSSCANSTRWGECEYNSNICYNCEEKSEWTLKE